jgi:hypothetical protein
MALFRDRRGKGKNVELGRKESFGAYNAKTGDKVDPNMDIKTSVTGGPIPGVPAPGSGPAYRASQATYDRVKNAKVPGAKNPGY